MTATAKTSPGLTNRSNPGSAPPRNRTRTAPGSLAIFSTVPTGPKSRASIIPASRATRSGARVSFTRTSGEFRPVDPSCWRASSL